MTPPTTHNHVLATGEREIGEMKMKASIFTVEHWAA
jgi:hypothetical protein